MTITEEHLFTAACLWEAAIDAKAEGEKERAADQLADTFNAQFFSHWANVGTCTVREQVAKLAPACDAAWEALTDEERDTNDAFDWTFVPQWLEANFFQIVRGF